MAGGRMGLREYYQRAVRGIVRFLRKFKNVRGVGDSDSGNSQVETDGPGLIRETPEKLHEKVPEVTWPWLKIAEKELGISEVSGNKHNPRIIEYHKATSLKAMADEVPWCSSFVNWCLKECGIPGTNSAAARSFLNWGQPVQFTKGAIVVFKRGTQPWQGHVGFAVDENAFAIKVLGGNQGNKVSYKWYLKSNFLGYRWPKT